MNVTSLGDLGASSGNRRDLRRPSLTTTIFLSLTMMLALGTFGVSNLHAQVEGDPPAEQPVSEETPPADPQPSDAPTSGDEGAATETTGSDSSGSGSSGSGSGGSGSGGSGSESSGSGSSGSGSADEPAPADSTPADSTPADSTPADSTPADSTPADAGEPETSGTGADEPAAEDPTGEAPAESDPATTEDPAESADTPIEPTPAAPAVDQLAFAEPNDGELLGGSVFAVRLNVNDPLGTSVAIFHGTTELAVTTSLVPVSETESGTRLATVLVNSSMLPNGVEDLRAELRDDAGTVLAEDLQTYTVDHPVAELIDSDFQCCTLQTATLAVTDSGLVDSSVPYLVLASRSVGTGIFSIFGDVVLPLPPLATQIIHSGTLSPTSATPTSLVTIPVYQSNVTEENPLHLIVLTFVDGVWKSSGEVTIGH